jgi:hypothetical protein
MSPHLKNWFASKPDPVFEHPTLGSFHVEGGIWTSRIPGAHPVELSLAGGSSAPNEGLLAAASALLERFPEVRDTALAFLVAQEGAPSKEDFSCYDIEWLREDAPDQFALRFLLLGDLGGMWRVEFEQGIPLFLTRDE